MSQPVDHADSTIVPFPDMTKKSPDVPIHVFLITDGPDLNALHRARFCHRDSQERILGFDLMPGAFYAESDDVPGRIVPALEQPLPIRIRLGYAIPEEENDDGALIIGQITDISLYTGYITGNPLWRDLRQLIKGEEVCLSYNFARKEGGLVPLPSMIIGSNSQVQRVSQDDKRRDPYRATADFRRPPYSRSIKPSKLI